MNQNVYLTASSTYQISYRLSVVGSVSVEVGADYAHTVTNATNVVVVGTFSHGVGTGNYSIQFVPQPGVTSITVYAIGLKKVGTVVNSNLPIKEFLTGDTDEGREIHFRADTQILQMQPSPEMYSNPIAIATRTDRGSMLKAYVSLDEKPFFELEGTVMKGVSIVKLETPSNLTPLDTSGPPLAKTIQLSYRDSSKQRCRILQAAIITTPTPIDHSP